MRRVLREASDFSEVNLGRCIGVTQQLLQSTMMREDHRKSRSLLWNNNTHVAADFV